MKQCGASNGAGAILRLDVALHVEALLRLAQRLRRDCHVALDWTCTIEQGPDESLSVRLVRSAPAVSGDVVHFLALLLSSQRLH
jgi:hypothetical protein